MVVCPFAPYGLAHGPKTGQIRYHRGPDFVEHISLKPLDGFTPFIVLWNCLHPAVYTCSWGYGLMTLTFDFQGQIF